MFEGIPAVHSESSRLSASLFRVLEMSADLIAVFDPELRHVYCNDGVCRFMKMAREVIIGRRYDQLQMSARNAERMQDVIARVFATGEPQRLEVRGHNRDTQAPTVFDISYHPELASDGSIEFVIGVSRDVSRLRFAEEAARAGAERLRILLDSVDVAIIGVNQRLEVDFTNHRAERELRPIMTAAFGPDSLAASEQRPVTGMPIAHLLSAANATPIMSHIVAVLEHGSVVSVEHDILAPEARRYAIQVVPERDVAGAVRGALLVARDITRERQRESQLRVSERLASLGRIAAGVAHEITNPLSAIYGNLELARLGIQNVAREQPPIAAQLAEYGEMLADAYDGAERIRQLVEEIGLLVRADTTITGRVDPGELIDKVVRMLGGAISVKARLRVRAEPVPEVAGSAPQLVQVLSNLLENAVLAMPRERAVEDNLIEIDLLREGNEVVLRISDNGSGIAPDALEHVFDPFYTTRAVGSGMGLGLSIAHGIATSHQGTLRLESIANRGSTVTLRLPIPED